MSIEGTMKIMAILDLLWIGLPATLPLSLVLVFFALVKPRKVPSLLLLMVGAAMLLFWFGIVGWRVWAQLTVECGDHTRPWVDCGGLARSTVGVPIMFGIPLVPVGLLLVLPWFINRTRFRRRVASHAMPRAFTP